MQPYFMPYIGYFQLVSAVDLFVIYDNIQYSKKGWVNRNRILAGDKDAYITIPLKKDSDYLDIVQRRLSHNVDEFKTKILSRIRESYRKAPFFNNGFELVVSILNDQDTNLFGFVYQSVIKTLDFLELDTKVIVSSSIDYDNSLKAQEKVLAICDKIEATTYINPIGGTNLYDYKDFKQRGIELLFLESQDVIYEQFQNTFVPWLSIIDVIMFNSKEKIKEYLKTGYILKTNGQVD